MTKKSKRCETIRLKVNGIERKKSCIPNQLTASKKTDDECLS